MNLIKTMTVSRKGKKWKYHKMVWPKDNYPWWHLTSP